MEGDAHPMSFKPLADATSDAIGQPKVSQVKRSMSTKQDPPLEACHAVSTDSSLPTQYKLRRVQSELEMPTLPSFASN